MDRSGGGTASSAARAKAVARPSWWDLYEVVGKIGEGTYGLVYLVRVKDKAQGYKLAIKKFKPSKDGDGVSPTAIREIMLLRECCHENIVKLVNVHINHADASLYLAFDYAEYDLYEIIRFHREKLQYAISPYTVKSLMWQILNGLHYLHSNWIIHRDLKPSNILVMREGDEAGVVKLGDFGLARIYQAPLKPLSDNGVVVTVWYRSPDLLLGAKHYTPAVDVWAVGCIFAELLTLKPLFQGVEDKGMHNPFQIDQIDKIFKVLGPPSVDTWPGLAHLPYWQHNRQSIQNKKYDHPLLPSMTAHFAKTAAYDLLTKMFEYDPAKRLTAEQALKHEYFRQEPLPGKNSFVSGYPGEKVVVYPSRPVDTSLDMGSNEPTPVGNTANPASGQQRRFQQQGGDQSGSGQGGTTTGSRLGPGGSGRRSDGRSQGQGPSKMQRR